MLSHKKIRILDFIKYVHHTSHLDFIVQYLILFL